MTRSPLISVVLRSVGLLALLAAIRPALASDVTAGVARPPFIPIEHRYLALPAGMQPVFPIFVSGGREIVFWNAADRAAWIVRVDGSGLHCITCGLSDAPARQGPFVYAFPDGNRLLMTHGVGKGVNFGPDADGVILECNHGYRDCTSHRFVPLDMSADRGDFRIIQRRTWHLAPDGEHIGWMEVRSDSTLMVVARLERLADRYVAADPRAVNPVGPVSAADDDPDRWENLSQLYELKSFTPDGKGILAVALPNNNIDILRIDLASGRTVRLTGHPDWDEDSSLSPDQTLLMNNSWRGRQRLSAIAWIPQIRGFTGLMMGAALAPFYVSTWTGFQCDLSAWLLPASGDRDGQLMGQPLAVFADDTVPGSHQEGDQNWSPDSTMLLLQERTRTKGVWSPNRIAIARLVRAPGRPVPSVRTVIGDWAVPARLYRGPHASDQVARVRGGAGGWATIAYSGSFDGDVSTKVEFDHFTDDGSTFVDGTMSGSSVSTGVAEKRLWTLLADVTVTGRHTGNLKMALHLDNSAKPLPQMSGDVSAVYDGRVAPPLPPLAPCYDSLPKATPLQLSLSRSPRGVRAAVSADVHGDKRPVMNATLRYDGRSFTTDAGGVAYLPVPRNQRPDITAQAGDTFVPVTVRVRASSERDHDP